MVRRCRDFGLDLARQPVPVMPTAHFLMGGVVIDPDCRTALEGLFVAGEDAGGVHGANRLGGNGVADSTVFGGIAGDVMADWVVGRERPRVSLRTAEDAAAAVQRPLGQGARDEVAPLRRALRDVMWEQVGLVRTGAGLTQALGRIEDLAEHIEESGVPGGPAYNPAWQEWLDARNQVEAARLIARSALERRESRGAHYRGDHPEADDDRGLVAIKLVRRGEGMTVWTEPVRFTRVRPAALAPTEMIEVGD